MLRLFRVATKSLFPLIIVPADCFKDIAIVHKHIVRNGSRSRIKQLSVYQGLIHLFSFCLIDWCVKGSSTVNIKQ